MPGWRCPNCGVLNAESLEACWTCGRRSDDTPGPVPHHPEPQGPPTCSSCGGWTVLRGRVPVRIGELGFFRETNERTWTLTAYRCSRCGRVEFYDPEDGLPGKVDQ